MKRKLRVVINEYIIENWLCNYTYPDGSYKFTDFAKEHYIDEKIARKIVSDKNYAMAIETLERICESRDLTLKQFFTLIGR
jgi:DNA-binding Xre family transcriptional regulator